MAEKIIYKHWRTHLDEDRLFWLTLDREGASVNSLSREVFDEFDKVIDEIAEIAPGGVILMSGKKKGFIAGADITQFSKLKTRDEAFDLIRQAQIILDRFEALSCPTVAIINGFCLGGGLELALACTYRVALDEAHVKIGLPEVKLGIHPGWGGTVRLPKLIGAFQAMRIMLAGSAVPASLAKKLGIVDAAVPLRELKRAARAFLVQRAHPYKASSLQKLSNSYLARIFLAPLFRTILRQKITRDQYPAPFAIIDNWKKVGVGPRAMVTEANSIADLMVTLQSRELVRAFFLQERLKSLGKITKGEFKNVHVIGAGTMGGDIAAWCALRGFKVSLQDQTAEQIAPAIKRAFKLFKKKLKKRHLIQKVMDRLIVDVHGYGLKTADVIIEAIVENKEIKQNVYKQIEPQIKPSAIIATNTSSIPLDELSKAFKDPTRLIGLHFFNPVAKMPLLEIVFSSKTNNELKNRAMNFAGRIGKLPLPVKSEPGFLVNRVLMPYLLEAVQLLDEGYKGEMIDAKAKQFGMPMGPIELADTVGLDVCLSVADILVNYYGGSIPDKLRELVDAGHLGVKSGRGFYRYSKGRRAGKMPFWITQPTEFFVNFIRPIWKAMGEKWSWFPKTNKNEPDSTDVTDRLILRMVNESVACWNQEIVSDADLLDAGLIFGTGFAPFRGGPLAYAKSRGVDDVVKTLEQFAQKYDDRFLPKDGWKKFENADMSETPVKKSAEFGVTIQNKGGDKFENKFHR